MAEAQHTCTATAGHTVQPPCPGCQEHYAKTYAKEREVLDAAVALAGSDYGRDDGTLLRVAREYAALRAGSLRG